MTAGKLGAELLEPFPASCAPSEVGNDAQSEWVAANAGEMFTEQVGGPTDIAGGRGVDHFNVMAFPAHRAATGGTRGCFRVSGEIGDGEPEVRISHNRATECLYGHGRVRGLLCLTIKGSGLKVGRDHPTVVFDRRTRGGRLATVGIGPF
jgi:hypothetical protein